MERSRSRSSSNRHNFGSEQSSLSSRVKTKNQEKDRIPHSSSSSISLNDQDENILNKINSVKDSSPSIKPSQSQQKPTFISNLDLQIYQRKQEDNFSSRNKQINQNQNVKSGTNSTNNDSIKESRLNAINEEPLRAPNIQQNTSAAKLQDASKQITKPVENNLAVPQNRSQDPQQGKKEDNRSQQYQSSNRDIRGDQHMNEHNHYSNSSQNQQSKISQNQTKYGKGECTIHSSSVNQQAKPIAPQALNQPNKVDQQGQVKNPVQKQELKQDKKVKVVKPKNPFGARTMYDSDESSSSCDDSSSNSISDIQRSCPQPVKSQISEVTNKSTSQNASISQSNPLKTNIELKQTTLVAPSSNQIPPSNQLPPTPNKIGQIQNLAGSKTIEKVNQDANSVQNANILISQQQSKSEVQKVVSSQKEHLPIQTIDKSILDSKPSSKESNVPLLLHSQSQNLKNTVQQQKEEQYFKHISIDSNQDNHPSYSLHIKEIPQIYKPLNIVSSISAPPSINNSLSTTNNNNNAQTQPVIKDPRLLFKMQEKEQKIQKFESKLKMQNQQATLLQNIGCPLFDEPDQIISHIYCNGQLFLKVSWKPRQKDKVQMPPTFIEYLKVQENYSYIFNKYMLKILSSSQIKL